MEEVSLTIDEAKVKKMVDEMLRQRCTSGGSINIILIRVKNFLEKCPLKSHHAKIFYIRKQKEPGKPKEEVYSNSKIIQVIKTYWELGHEHKFITEIVSRSANECIVLITELDYKNLNKNDIEDMYLLIMNGKVPDYAETGLLWSLSVFIRSSVIWERVHDFQHGIESYQQKDNLTAPTILIPGVENHKMFSIIYEPVHGIIYKNRKKEKRVMRHSEIHKFCDATLNRVLEGLKSYNNDVKYGYVQREVTNDEVEYLKLFEEEIEVRLKYHNQMRKMGDMHFLHVGHAMFLEFKKGLELLGLPVEYGISKELREDTFSGNKNEDTHEHVERVLDIVSLFNIPGVHKMQLRCAYYHSHLLEHLKDGWTDSPQEPLTPGNSLKKPLSKGDDLTWTKHGPIPSMTLAQALTAIQTMAYHSQKWHDNSSSRNIGGSNNTDGLAAIVSKLDNLGHDMKKFKENDTTETDKNYCTSLLKDLLTHLGYYVGRDDIFNIVSLRKHSSPV
ncbi:hypothetical protein Tco_0294384 [Tanacetum coccineum]